MISMMLSVVLYASPAKGEVFFLGENYPAIYGKVETPTPKGTFTLKRAYSTHLKTNVIIFYRDGSGAYAIHENLKTRTHQINTKTITDNYLSNGCIGVNPVLFNQIWNYKGQITIVIQ